MCIFILPAYAANIPNHLQKALDDAYKTKNPLVIEAVQQLVTTQMNDIAAKKSGKASPKTITTAQPQKEKIIPKKAKTDEKPKKKWEGNVELGASFEAGNSEEERLHVAGNYSYDFGTWKNITKFSGENQKSEAIRTNEEYRINNQSKLALSEKDYSFLELDYVNDRYSGFDYRLSETVGYGRTFFKNQKLNWIGELGLGARQTKSTSSTSDNNLLVTARTQANWAITDTLSAEQELKSAYSVENLISSSHTALKSSITKDLYLKLAFDLEHIGDVPADTKHTDTKTSLMVGYEF